MTWLSKGGFIAQLVEHRAGIAEATGFESNRGLIFLQESFSTVA